MANAHMKPIRTLIVRAALIYCQLMLLSRSFQSRRVLETGLSNFHLMTLAVMKEKVSGGCNLELSVIGPVRAAH